MTVRHMKQSLIVISSAAAILALYSADRVQGVDFLMAEVAGPSRVSTTDSRGDSRGKSRTADRDRTAIDAVTDISPRPHTHEIIAVCGDGLCAGDIGEDFGNCPDDCGSLDDRADYLKASLESNFFTVDDGGFVIADASDCEHLDHCWFNNPTSPYGIPFVPLGPGEPNPDPESRFPSPVDLPSMFGVYRLQPDEALVWVGTTPPESPYFSFTAYVFSRFDPAALGEPPYDDRVEVFASLGDSLNQLTINTSAQPGESPFGKESVVIVTADKGVDLAVREVLDGAGFSESVANTLVIPRFDTDGVTPIARMGYDNQDDVFVVMARIAHPDAEQPGTPIRAWLDDPGARLFRIRPNGPGPLDPHTLPALRPRGTGEHEDGASLRRLVRSIEAAYSDMESSTRMAFPTPWEDGYICLENLIPCFADCRDTPYMGAAHRLGSEPEAIIVAGYNHEKTGKASYVNITATRALDGTAYGSVVMRDLAGSADVYIPRDPDRENLWQVKFARECGEEPFCYEITEEQIPRAGLVTILVRAYLDPATGTAPKALPMSESELVFPRVIKVNCVDSCLPGD